MAYPIIDIKPAEYELDPQVKAYLVAEQQRQANIASPEYQAALSRDRYRDAEAQRQQNDLASYAQGFSQLGTIGGRAPSTEAVRTATAGANAAQAQLRGGLAQDQAASDQRQALQQKTMDYLQKRKDQDTDAKYQAYLKGVSQQMADRSADEAFGRQVQLAGLNAANAREISEANFGHHLDLQKLKNEGAAALSSLKAQNAPPGKEPSKEQFDAAAYAKRMEQAEDIFGSLASENYNRASPREGIKATLLPEPLQSDKLKQQNQAERNFVNAILRRQSGAAISKSEFESAEAQYFPRPGDSPQVLAQKKQNRLQDIASMKAASGRAFDITPNVAIQQPKQMPESGTAQAAPAPAPTPAPSVGTIEDGHEFLGGDPGNPASWRPVQ